MPFVKLDTGITGSSLWFEKEQRDIFITALLMATPKLFDAPLPQLFVDRLEPTGWSAPPGMYGFVAAAGTGILRMAMVEGERAMIALQQLGEPDCDSRSNEYEGRRMIRINGGYIILNYMKYRDYDVTAAERSRRYREKKMLSATRNVVTDTRDATSPVTHTDAEADAEEKKQKPTRKLAGSVDSVDLPLSLGTKEFRNSLQNWVDHKKLKRDPMTQHAIGLLVKKCEALGPEKAIAAINLSIERGWRGVWPDEQSHNGNGSGSHAKSESRSRSPI